MGTKYPGVTSSGYNNLPPSDDGAQIASNLVTWAGVKTKLADPIKTLADAENTALVSAFDLSARAISSNDTAIASDHWKTLQVTGATTIQLSSAASMGAGYEVGVFNAGASVVTVAPAGSDTINAVSASVTIAIKGSMIFRTNQALTGYNVVGQSNRMDAGSIDGVVIGAATPAAATVTTLTTTGAIVGGTTGKIATTFGVGNATPSASGSGVSFPATQSASTDVNTLDDYEEGTWTPSLGGNTTYSIQTGIYTKVGRLVNFQCLLSITAIGTGSTVVISGLPFSASIGHGCVVSNWSGGATAVVFLNAHIGTNTITMQSMTAAGTGVAANAFFANGTVAFITGSYST